jgi:beta-lactamase class A
MMKFLCGAVLVAMFAVAACDYRADIPTDFPTPPIPVATPLTKLELKRDAELEKQIEKIIIDAKGTVGVAAIVLETGEAALVNAEHHYPMQSVYKLPIAMAVMDQVRLGKLDLDEKVGVTKDDMVRQGMRSPLRDQNPNGGEFTIRELIRLSLVESDGTASDVLMRVAGGATDIQSFLTQIGVRELRVVNTEKEIGRDWQTQYENSSTPGAAVELLRWLDTSDRTAAANSEADSAAADESPAGLVRRFMADSLPGERRLKALLPKGTVVAHKTGTGGTQNGITGATNDIGIIYLPDGRHLAIAVFVSDSKGTDAERETVIAKVAKAAWNRWAGTAPAAGVKSANFNERHTLN